MILLFSSTQKEARSDFHQLYRRLNEQDMIDSPSILIRNPDTKEKNGKVLCPKLQIPLSYCLNFPKIR